MLSAKVDSPAGLRRRQWPFRFLSFERAWRILVIFALASGLLNPANSLATSPSVSDPLITSQPVRQHRNLGESVTFRVTANGTAPLHYQWRKDEVLLPQANDSTLSLTNLQPSDAGSYSVIVSNPTGNAVTSAPALLTVNLALLDSQFKANMPYQQGYPLAIQGDGKILITSYDTASPQSNFLVRLLPTGARDPGFQVAATNGFNVGFNSGALQEDGKIVVGGSFTNLNGQTRNRIGRINSTGTIDAGFSLGANGWIESFFSVPIVSSLARQANGRILVGGTFTNIAGLNRINLARLEVDGAADNSFSSGFRDPAGTEVACIAIQTDDRFLVGGTFTSQYQPVRANLMRFNADGSFDPSFDSGIGGAGAGTVSALAVQADGKILVGSKFTGSGYGYLSNLVFRLNSDGSPDDSFNPRIIGHQPRTIRSITLQCDGKIIVVGSFVEAGGTSRTNLLRLHPNGTLDHGFTPEPWVSNNPPSIRHLMLQSDGNILVAGFFSHLAGQSCTNIGRLLNPDPATQNLTYDGSTITWLRGGSSPEVHRTTFEHSTDGVVWSSIGSGNRIPGGWQLPSVSIPLGGTIRARGHIICDGGRSSWFVETVTRLRPVILSKDSSFGVISNRFGFLGLGWPGRELVVEGSTDLTNWIDLKTNIAGTAPVPFFDTNWHLIPQRFYRTRAQ